MTNLKKIWQEYAPLYNKLTPIIQQDLLDNIGHEINGDVLDAGCAVGKLIPYMNSAKINKYTGIDNINEMLQFAKQKYNTHIFPTNFLLNDILSTEMENNSVDTVTMINVLYSVSNPKKALKGINNILKKGGSFYLATPNTKLNMEELQRINKADLLSRYKKSEVEKYCQINDTLAGLNKKFKPHLFSLEEITNLLLNTGFDMIQFRDEAYDGQLHNIKCIKK